MSIAGLVGELRLAVGFLTRLPINLTTPPPPDGLARSMRVFPLVGGAIGLVIGVAYGAARLILPPLPAAILAVTCGVLLTGALHEDGLADSADGLGGGRNPESKLAIMRDSRIGSYGALALILSGLMRTSCLAALDRPLLVTGALVAAHALSRAALPLTMMWLPPASDRGLAAQAGRPRAREAWPALATGLVLTAAVLPHESAVAAILAVAVMALGVGLLGKRQIGGYSGDLLGALQQGSEIAALLAVVAYRTPAL